MKPQGPDSNPQGPQSKPMGARLEPTESGLKPSGSRLEPVVFRFPNFPAWETDALLIQPSYLVHTCIQTYIEVYMYACMHAYINKHSLAVLLSFESLVFSMRQG